MKQLLILIAVFGLVGAIGGVVSAETTATFTVNTNGDGVDINPGDKRCETSTRTCSLRAAMMEANLGSGTDTIRFDSSYTIEIASVLPEIENGMTIDGITGNSSSCPTSLVPANLGVTLEGNISQINPNLHGLHITDGNGKVIITGLRIVNFPGSGIRVDNDVQSEVSIRCNEIGFRDGVAEPNERGVFVGGEGHTVGGTLSSSRNVISGNRLSGVLVNNDSAEIDILNNYIGVLPDGSSPLGNGLHGVTLLLTVNDVAIGGLQNGNIIAHNEVGVCLNADFANTQGNTIRYNSIHSNTLLGIDLKAPCDMGVVTPNDLGDVDDGTNGLLNFPEIVSIDGHTGIVDMRYQSADGDYTIDIYSNDSCNASGHGGGQKWLTSLTVTVIDGEATFNPMLSLIPSTGTWLTATATDGNGSTSEFSACREVVAASIHLVNDNGDTEDANGCDATHCTLREAIEAARDDSDISVIQFSHPMTIIINSGASLPTISRYRVHIDGITGTGATCPANNTPADLKVVIVGDPANSSTSFTGLRFINNPSGISTNGSSIRGIAVLGFAGTGIQLSGNPTNRLQDFSITCSHIGAHNGQINGNNWGLSLAIVDGAIIGGSDPADRNVISGNVFEGIASHTGNISNNRILGNYIGVMADGVTPAGNGRHGIYFLDDEIQNNVVGAEGAGNVIAYSGADGIAALTNIANNFGNSFRFNSIFGNGDVGIDLGSGNVTANDDGDEDEGFNGLQNFPTLFSADFSGNVTGYLSSSNGIFTIDVYQNSDCHSSGHGEGETWIASFEHDTASSRAPIPFDTDLGTALTAGNDIAMTATDADGNTSEFSACIEVAGAPTAVVTGGQQSTYSRSTGIVLCGLILLVAATAGELWFGRNHGSLTDR